MTLLELVTEFCRRTGLAIPASVYGNLDTQVAQIYALLQEGCNAMQKRGAWQALTMECTFSTVADEDQGDILGTGLGSGPTALVGFDWLLPRTLWDRTQMIPLVGPTTPREWQMYKAIVITGPQYSFRLRGNHFLVTPAPPAAHTWAFEYISKYWVLDTDGTTQKQSFTADTDTVLFPDEVVLADLRWRWKLEKGLAYDEFFNAAEAMIVDAVGREPHKVISMDNRGNRDPRPGIWVPAGSWLQP